MNEFYEKKAEAEQKASKGKSLDNTAPKGPNIRKPSYVAKAHQ